MALIAILLALGLQWYFAIRYDLNDYDWFTPYVNFCQEKLQNTGVWAGYAGLAAIVVPVLLVIWLVNGLLGHGILHLVQIVFCAAVLWYCIDARSLEALFAEYFASGKTDDLVKDYIGKPVPRTKAGVARKMSNTILTNALHNLFALIFWFLLLGPMGSALYFVVSLVANDFADASKPFNEQAKTVRGVLDWVPVRLMGLSFALMGSFGKVFRYWISTVTDGIEQADEQVAHYGLTAIEADPRDSKGADNQESQEIADLVFRSVIVWLVLLGAVTLASLF